MQYRAVKKFPTGLKLIKYEVEKWAREWGLDFFDVVFEVVDWQEMNEIASYGGFPVRYPHWTFGMEYERMSKGYAYGLQRIYEMVVNTDPCYAYLLESNNIVDQKLVICHVMAHAHVFKNNVWFAHTNRKMMDEMANHGSRIRHYVEKYGHEAVETFIDRCLSIDDQVDYHLPFVKRQDDADSDEEEDTPTVQRMPSKGYMDSFINPQEFLDREKRKIKEEVDRKKRKKMAPDRDLLRVLSEQAPIENWQADILSIIRDESYYFAPQGQTKVLNEGAACVVHSALMAEHMATDADIIDCADHHAGTLAPNPWYLNPYKLGYDLLLDIKERWDKGRFGKDYEECEDHQKKTKWDTGAMLGKRKILEVVKFYNDVMLIDEFLTPEFCKQSKIFTSRYEDKVDLWLIDEREFSKVKKQILFSLTNHGRPFIYVEDINYANRSELYLKHRHGEYELKMIDTLTVLENIFAIWQRSVHLETVVSDKPMLLTYDGKAHTSKGVV